MVSKTAPKLPDKDYNYKWPREKEFKFVKKQSDPRFGEITIKKNHKTLEVVFCKEKLAHSQNEATNNILQLRSRQNLNHPNMLQMLGYSAQIKKNLCSTSYLTQGYYRYPPTDLKRELKEHKERGTQFSNHDLNKIRDDMANALHHLHSKNLKHGDIRPIYTGKDKKTNTHLLLDRFKDQSNVEKTQTNNLINKRELFMSPELYKKLQGKVKSQTYDAKK